MIFADHRIRIDRELSDLDKFVLNFTGTLEKHTKYVIVSGYVSILLGRARVSEDIDIIIPRMSPQDFKALLADVQKKGFYCLNAEKEEDIFNQIDENTPIRLAINETVIPNIELKFEKNSIDKTTLEDRITVMIGKDRLSISPLELQIAFKEEVLKFPKDIEDARHLRHVAQKHLNMGKIESYKRLMHEIYFGQRKRKA